MCQNLHTSSAHQSTYMSEVSPSVEITACSGYRQHAQFWFCHNPGGYSTHYAGPWLLATTGQCQDENCGHIRCPQCAIE